MGVQKSDSHFLLKAGLCPGWVSKEKGCPVSDLAKCYGDKEPAGSQDSVDGAQHTVDSLSHRLRGVPVGVSIDKQDVHRTLLNDHIKVAVREREAQHVCHLPSDTCQQGSKD